VSRLGDRLGAAGGGRIPAGAAGDRQDADGSKERWDPQTGRHGLIVDPVLPSGRTELGSPQPTRSGIGERVSNDQQPADSYDVAILGGGLAGLTLGLQIKQERPETSVFIAEKREGLAPEAAFKVG